MIYRKIAVLIVRILGLTVIGFITMAIASAITPRPEFLKAIPASTSSQSAGMLIFVRFILALIFAFILEKTTLRGFRLISLLFWVDFGVTTFVMQLETIIFGSAFPMLSTVDVIMMAFTSLVGTLLFVPLSVLVMGKLKGISTSQKTLIQVINPGRIAMLALLFPIIYFLFGYLVAWQSSAVRDFYATTTITNNQPVLMLIQVGRGILWVLAGLPLFMMFEKRIHAVIASTLCYSLFPSIALLLPNPLMPEAVRMAHFVEISLSMALFGLAAGWLMTGKTRIKVNKAVVLST